MKVKATKTLAFAALIGMYACGGAETQDETTTGAIDSTGNETIEAPAEEEVEELSFDGIEKGDFLLYGKKDIEPNGEAISVDEMLAKVEENGNFEGKVNVTINEVCKKAGCWMTFNSSDDESIRVFFRDHFTIPPSTEAGTDAILYGKVVNDTLTVDFQKHLLDDAKESGEEVAQEEYDAITEDVVEVTFDCEAILVKQ